jgi:hypothetical protein
MIIPLARSSSISSSLSFADMDKYNAVTEYRFDWRTERDPSCEDIVFWRETGMKDEEVDDVDAREGACSIETAMFGAAETACCDQRQMGCLYTPISVLLVGYRQQRALRYRGNRVCCSKTAGATALCVQNSLAGVV